MSYKIPNEILNVLDEFAKSGYEAYLVGGCVRDLLRGVAPKDWDITTSAKPEEIQKIFENSFYENDFGTVGIVTDSETPPLKLVEATPFRFEAKYSDKRHPDIIKFADKLEDDLKRRDFTVNAMAMLVDQSAFFYSSEGNKDRAGFNEKDELEEKYIKLIDLFGGVDDLKNKIIRSVGVPDERFGEDALRILRAVRLAAEMKFSIEKNTRDSIQRNTRFLRMISKERIRDEFSKLLLSKNPEYGIKEMNQIGILKYVAPELEEGIGVTQNKEHIFTVWEHNLRALSHASSKDFPLEVRMAAFLHDVAKPRSKRGEGPDSTFYNHEVVGAKMSIQILSRLKYSKKFIEKVAKLVRWHLFFSDTEVITLSAVRRIVRNVGPENVWDLMNVRFCDRIGMGRPKEEPYRLRKYESMIEEALRSPLSVSKLEIDGTRVMEFAGIQPGPKVGFILHALLNEVLDDPSLNTKEYMEKRAVELAKLSDDELVKIGESGKVRKEEEEKKEITQIRKKYGVK